MHPINYGIKTGFNEAFIIDGKTKDELIRQSPKSAEIIHPFIEGKDIKRYKVDERDLWIIFSKRGVDIDKYPAVKEHLHNYFLKLRPRNNNESTGRKPGPYTWYEIQDNVAYYKDFDRPKIVWDNLNLFPNFAFGKEGLYVNAPSNFLTSQTVNIPFLLAVLNSSVNAFILKQIAYSREGGYFEYKKQFVEQIVIPSATREITALLETLVLSINNQIRSQNSTQKLEAEIDEVVYKIYNLSDSERLYIRNHI